MKKIFLLLMLLIAARAGFCQTQPVDTNYNIRLTSVVWMPDGKSLFLSLVKFHKTNRQAPFFSKTFRYDLLTKNITEMFENGSNIAPSPDGKIIAYLKRDDRKNADIYLYSTETKQQTVLQTDTMRKNALDWSLDGKKLLYNISYNGTGRFATIDICVLDIATKKITQVTHSGTHKSYTPKWSPDSKNIAYYLETGDGRDQIWLTDATGSFHTNLTNDTTTLNYYPGWIDKKTIIYTLNPETIMTINTDGTNKKKVEGISSSQVKFNPTTGMLVYLSEPDNNVVQFDWKKKTSKVLISKDEWGKLSW